MRNSLAKFLAILSILAIPVSTSIAAAPIGIYGQVIDNAGKGIANVAVTLSQNGAAVANTTSSSDGSYNLPVAAGAYSIKFVPPTTANGTLFGYDLIAPLPQKLKVMLTTPMPGRAFVTGNISASNGEPVNTDVNVGVAGAAAYVDVNGDYRLTPTAGSSGNWNVEGTLKNSGMYFKMAGLTATTINQDTLANFVVPVATQRIHLVTDKGTPVANALIRAGVGRMGQPSAPMKSIEGLGAFQGSWENDFTTDVNGYATFEYESLAAPTQTLFMVNPPAKYKYDFQSFHNVVGTGDITLTLSNPVALLTGSVKDQKGTAMDNVIVGPGGTTDGSGNYAGTQLVGNNPSYSLLYRADGSYNSNNFAFSMSSTSTVKIAGDLVQNYVIPVDKTKLTVLDPNGKPVANAWVSYTVGDMGASNAPSTPLGKVTILAGKSPFSVYNWSQSTTDANGVAYLPSIHLDAEVLGRIVIAPASSSPWAANISYPNLGLGRDITVKLPVPSVNVFGKVTLTDPSVVRGLTVSLPDYLGDGSGGSGQIDSSGNYKFTVKKGLSTSDWSISAPRKDANGNFAPLSFDIAVGPKKVINADTVQNFAIATTKIPVRVVNPQGQGLAKVDLMLASFNSAGGLNPGEVNLVPGDPAYSAGYVGRATTDATGLAMVPALVTLNPISAVLQITPDPLSRYQTRNVNITVGDNSQNLIVLTIPSPIINGVTLSTIAGVKTVTITGDNLVGAISVAANSTNIAKFTVVNTNTITFALPATGTTYSSVTVTNGGGSATLGKLSLK